MTHPEGRTPGRQTLLCGGTAFRRDTHATRFHQNPGTNIPGINRINPGGSQAGPRTCHSRTGPGGHSEGQNTRSHPELGRENPQRQWYCVSRRGRVGRRQARPISLPPTAGWSSPVARQAHNLKVRGSNPLPATKHKTNSNAAATRCGVRVCGQARCGVNACFWHGATFTGAACELRMQLFHIGRRQRVRASTTAEIDSVGCFEDPGAVEIKRIEQSGLVPCDVRIDAAQRICIHKEWNLERLVVCPKAHAILPSVVASTLIRETEWHSAHHKRFPCLCPDSSERCQGKSVGRASLAAMRVNDVLAYRSTMSVRPVQPSIVRDCYTANRRCAKQRYPCSAHRFARPPMHSRTLCCT